MTGLWANDRDTLAKALDAVDHEPTLVNPWYVADRLINTGAVRVLDPNDTELVEPAAEALWVASRKGHPIPWRDLDEDMRDEWRARTRAAVEALRQP